MKARKVMQNNNKRRNHSSSSKSSLKEKTRGIRESENLLVDYKSSCSSSFCRNKRKWEIWFERSTAATATVTHQKTCSHSLLLLLCKWPVRVNGCIDLPASKQNWGMNAHISLSLSSLLCNLISSVSNSCKHSPHFQHFLPLPLWKAGAPGNVQSKATFKSLSFAV